MDTTERITHEVDELQGQAKETVGDATDDHSLQAEGIGEQITADADKTVDDIREGVDDGRHDHQH
ncbi:MAG TPA: CsbD family protein [Candidatus Limnocylindrales bacterium]|nr:CsbD family protein [Candidatus Limnocylindrales bacterium]